MGRASSIASAVAVALLGDVTESAASDDFGVDRRWIAPLELPPGATVYIAPFASWAFEDELRCDSGFRARPPPPRPPGPPPTPRVRDPDDPWDINPRYDVVSGASRTTARQVVGDLAGQPLYATVEAREIDREYGRFVLAVAVGSPVGPFTLDYPSSSVMPDVTWKDGRPLGARVHRITASPSPAWMIAAAAVTPDSAPDDPLLVERGPCAEVGVRAAGVGYAAVETARCLDYLLTPPRRTPDETDDLEARVFVPHRCLDAGGAIDVVAYHFDGAVRRHRVLAAAAPRSPTGPGFGAVVIVCALLLVWMYRRHLRSRPLRGLGTRR